MQKIKDINTFWSNYELDRTNSLDTKQAGSVYKSLDKNDKEWAVKISEIHPNFDNGLLLERYTIAKTLDHTNLLPYKEGYRFEEELMTNIAVMPIIESGSLDLHWDILEDEDKFLVGEQIIDGLYYLHKKGIVWQNLSAKHILLDKQYGNYVPLFINYGNKKRIPLAFFPDYEYLAPEQFSEETLITKQADIWALGVLLYKLWTGRMPFGEKSASLPNAKIKERILGTWQFGLIENIPAPYQQIVKKCLCREIEERWTDCGEIIVVIKDWYAQGHTIQNIDKPVSITTTTSGRKIRRKPNQPIIWWQVLLWVFVAGFLGYCVNKI